VILRGDSGTLAGDLSGTEARHDVWGLGERELVVPRHVEINEYTAKAIIREAQGGHR
jgi:hypothetical protein